MTAAYAQPFPSLPLDTTYIPGPDVAHPERTACAFSDTLGLVAWIDEFSALKATRVTGSVVPLDTSALFLAGDWALANASGRVSVAASPTGFLAAWVSFKDYQYCVRAVVVDHSGWVSRRVRLDSVYNDIMENVDVAYGAGVFCVVWQHRLPTGYEVHFSRISADGDLLDPVPREVSPNTAAFEFRPRVGFGDSTFFIAWVLDSMGYRTWGTLVRPDGSLCDSAGFPVTPPFDSPVVEEVVYDGTCFVAAMRVSPDLVAIRVNQVGEVLDSAPVRVGGRPLQHSVAAAAYGDTTLFMWARWLDSTATDTCVVCARRMDSQGRMLDSVPIRVSTPWTQGDQGRYNPGRASMAWTGQDFLAVWRHYLWPEGHATAQNSDVVGRRVSTSGAVLDTAERVLSLAANSQYEADVASDGRRFLAVWTDVRPNDSPPQMLRGALFTAEGRVPGTGGFEVGDPGSHTCGVAYGGGVYLVAWYSSGVVKSVRVDTTGRVLDPVPIVVHVPTTWSFRPDVAYGGGLFMVVWRDSKAKQYGKRVSVEGVVLDSAPIRLWLILRDDKNPGVACDGDNFLVVRSSPQHLRALRVSPQGVVQDTYPNAFGYPHDAWRFTPTAFGSGVYLVVLDDSPVGWRISPQGVVLDTAIHYPLEPLRAHESALEFDGANFLVATVDCHRGRLGGVRISPEGRVLDPVPLHLTPALPGGFLEECTGVASDSAGNVAVVLTSHDPDPYQTLRVRAVTFPRIVGLGEAMLRKTEPPRSAVWPNPARGEVQVALQVEQPGRYVIGLYDAAGRKRRGTAVTFVACGHMTVRFDVRGCEPGVYFVQASPGNARHKVVIAK